MSHHLGSGAFLTWGVQVLPIPARREDDSSSDSIRAEFRRELTSILRVAWSKALTIAGAAVANGDPVIGLRHWVSCEHTEARLERGHLVVLRTIRHIVHRHATGLLDTSIGILRYSLIGAVVWRLEVERGCPVVAEVLTVGATGACGHRGRVIGDWLHLPFVSNNMRQADADEP